MGHDEAGSGSAGHDQIAELRQVLQDGRLPGAQRQPLFPELAEGDSDLPLLGVWVDPEDVNDIAAKIKWLADEKNYEAQCKKVAAFSFTHSYEEIADEILDVYRKIVV